MKPVNQIFNRIKMLNPTVSEISSMGSFVSQANQDVADSIRQEVYSALPAQSLAYKILNSTDKFSEKQLWVIAFELEKNEAYAATVKDFYEEINRDETRKKASRKAKKENTIKDLSPKVAVEAKKEDPSVMYGVGAQLEHDRFGTGIVVAEDQDRITINFEEVGNKNLLKQFTKFTNQ